MKINGTSSSKYFGIYKKTQVERNSATTYIKKRIKFYQKVFVTFL